MTEPQEPLVAVTEQALLEMTQEALVHSRIETACALYGLIAADKVVVTGVIRPSQYDIERRFATTAVGGPRQAAALDWLRANYKLQQKLGLSPQDARFGFLFSAHSHHQLMFDQYSSQDVLSMQDAIREGMSVAIGPLITLKDKGPVISTLITRKGTVKVTLNQQVWIKFYYLSQTMWQAGNQMPIIVTPQIVSAAETPLMPPLGWQFVREDDYLEQLRHLTNFGCEAKVVVREIMDGPPLEIQFLVTNPDWKGMLSIITRADYPMSPPIFDVVPLNGAGEPRRFHAADQLTTGPLWQIGWDLIESIHQLRRNEVL